MSTVAEPAAPKTQVVGRGPRPKLLRGRAAVLIGVVLLGIGLRHAVTGLSPLLTDVREALGIGTAGATFIGMLPTLCFGTAGFLASTVVRRIGAEATALLAVALAAVATLLRPYAGGPTAFIVLSAVALIGMGFGNVIGAPLVKKYFPDRQAIMVTVFALLMQAGATLPAMTAVPVAKVFGWRASLPTGCPARAATGSVPLVTLSVAGPLGYVGILLGIGPAWSMALIAGLAGGAFPLAIAMFNLRTHTTLGSAALAGFAMGLGYLAGTLGPLLGGWLYAKTGGWTTALWVYVCTGVPMTIGGLMMARPGRYLEDTFASS